MWAGGYKPSNSKKRRAKGNQGTVISKEDLISHRGPKIEKKKKIQARGKKKRGNLGAGKGVCNIPRVKTGGPEKQKVTGRRKKNEEGLSLQDENQSWGGRGEESDKNGGGSVLFCQNRGTGGKVRRTKARRKRGIFPRERGKGARNSTSLSAHHLGKVYWE